MAKHSRKVSPYRCSASSEHELERWCLEQAISLGTWSNAGLNAEYVRGQLDGLWKVMRCGCTFVALVGLESLHNPARSSSRATRSEAKGRQ